MDIKFDLQPCFLHFILFLMILKYYLQMLLDFFGKFGLIGFTMKKTYRLIINKNYKLTLKK